MLDWIADYVERWSAYVAREVRDLVHWGLHAVAGVVYSVFHAVSGGWDWMLTGTAGLWKYAEGFSLEVAAWFRQIVEHEIPALWLDLVGLAHQVGVDIGHAINYVLGKVEALGAAVGRRIDDLAAYVDTHVLKPLTARADQIYNDLLKWGYYSWQLLTHPARLADILLGYLIASAEAAFWTIADPVGRFLFAVLLKNATRFARLIETILTAVL